MTSTHRRCCAASDDEGDTDGDGDDGDGNNGNDDYFSHNILHYYNMLRRVIL